MAQLSYQYTNYVQGNVLDGRFGQMAVDPQATRLVAGGCFDDPSNFGRVAVYTINDMGGGSVTLTQMGPDIVGTTPGEGLGIRVEINDNADRIYLASRDCHVKVYDYDPTGTSGIGGNEFWYLVYTTPDIGISITNDYYALTLKCSTYITSGDSFMVTNPDSAGNGGINYFYQYDGLTWNYLPSATYGGPDGSNTARWICDVKNDNQLMITCSNLPGVDVEVVQWNGGTQSWDPRDVIPVGANFRAQMVGMTVNANLIGIFLKGDGTVGNESRLNFYDYDSGGGTWILRTAATIMFSNSAVGLNTILFSYAADSGTPPVLTYFTIGSGDVNDPAGIYEWVSSQNKWYDVMRLKSSLATQLPGPDPAIYLPTGISFVENYMTLAFVPWSQTDSTTDDTINGFSTYFSTGPFPSETVDDFTPPNRTIVNNVTGGDTPSILANDYQLTPSDEEISIDTDGGLTGVTVSMSGNALNVPINTPVGNYDVTYHIRNIFGGPDTNISTVYIRVVSTQPENVNYPTNDLRVLKWNIVNTSNNDGNVYVNPVQDTSNPTIYESMILDGYTGTFGPQIMAIANALYDRFHRAASVVVNTTTNNLDGTNQTTTRFYSNGLEITLIY